MKDKIVLGLGALLILLALVKPDLSWIKPVDKVPVSVDVVVIENVDSETQQAVKPVVDALKAGPSDRQVDGKRLASLFNDMATLISLDGQDQVVKTTEDIRQANSLAGNMLKLNMKEKYPDLKKSCEDYVKSVIGDDEQLLDGETGLRDKAVKVFKGLAWACNEGSK